MQGSPPAWMTKAASAANSMGPIPLPPVVGVWVAVAIITVLIMSRTTFGRQIYSYGASPRAAEFALVRPKLLWTCVFAFSALTSCVAGVMLAGFTGYGDLHSGDTYLFDTVAAVIIGGTSLLGGRGGYVRTVAGRSRSFGRDHPRRLRRRSLAQQAALGAIILFFVSLYGRERHIRKRI